MGRDWHNLSPETALKELGSGFGGISESEAGERLAKYGRNAIARPKRLRAMKILLKQFASILVLILIIAGAVAWAFGDVLDAVAILAIVLLNAALGFVQEFRAEKAIEALKKMTALHTTAIRDGIKRKVDAEEIVPGDVIEFEAGSKLPADLRILEAFNLYADQALLTGESSPVAKNAEAIFGERAIAERGNLLFANTIVTSGRGTGVAVGTGMETEFGKIAGFIREFEKEQSPLKKKLESFAGRLGLFVVLVAIAVMALNIMHGAELLTSIMVAVALGVAAIPEGLPAVITITLAFGILQMSRKNAIVRRMPSVEALGSTTVICSDKTGTLTRNEMAVERVMVNNSILTVTGSGYSPEGDFLLGSKKVGVAENAELSRLLEIGLFCNNSVLGSEGGLWSVVGDPLEGALAVAAKKASIRDSRHKVDEIPFSSERKMMTTIHEAGNKTVAYSKGALERILGICDYVMEGGMVKPLGRDERERALASGNALASEAYKVLGFSFKELGSAAEKRNAESSMVFVGFAALSDPAREGVREAISVCRSAGISVKMITGDALDTANAIAKQVGIGEGEGLLGTEIDKMNSRQLQAAVGGTAVFARVDPKHKLRIVEALKANNEVVAVTGDGVNDAPALKKADIGIAMGIKGTDVTKETADIVLQDDDFKTIVSAVREGRRIYTNIKNFVKYLLAANFGEIGIVAGATAMGAPLPLLPLQILWVNIATDSLPALALGNEPAEKESMHSRPRNPKHGILHGVKLFIAVAALLSLFVTATAYLYGMQHDIAAGTAFSGLDVPSKARTMAFTALVVFELALVFSCRSGKGALELDPFTNKALIAAVAASFIMQAAVIYVPALQVFFRTVPLAPEDWVVIAMLAFTSASVPYIAAWVKRLFRRD